MKTIFKNIILLLHLTVLLISCKEEKVKDGFDFDYFTVFDKDSNKIEIKVRSTFQIASDYRDQLREEYGRLYKDSFLLPLTSDVTKNILSKYSAGEIYNYKRAEIEQELKDIIAIEFKDEQIELESFFISSVNLPNDLRDRLVNQRIDRINTVKIESIELDTFKLGDVAVMTKQEFPSEKNSFFSCHSSLFVLRDSQKIDSLKYRGIEALGGHFGFRNIQKIDSHLIITKHGGYDGRTIIINPKGTIFNLIGGQPFLDKEKNYLFSIYDSDLSGFSIFDLTTDSLLLAIEHFEERPKSFHKAFNNRYFITFHDEETDRESIWEFEPALRRIMQVDLDSTQMNSSNELTNLVKE